VKQRIFLIIPTIWAILFSLSSFPSNAHAQSADPVVRAVLFYSPTCPHCAMVIQEDLPPLLEKYGTQLEIIGVDSSQIDGAVLYQAAIDRFQIPENRLGVPTLIVGDTVLVGSIEIPEQLPVLIEYHLSQGGVDWPDIPGLADTLAIAMAEQGGGSSAPQHATEESASSPQEASPASNPNDPKPTEAPGLTLADEHNASWQEKFARDPAGNTLSVFVLVGMLSALVWGTHYFTRPERHLYELTASWLIPALCLVGLVVAGYLAYVETAQVFAVCGPVGDCNTVQQSEYARLFGMLPIGVLGLAGYVLIILAWLGARYGRNDLQNLGALVLLGMTFVGTLFSVYLTFLEPFVIGATCAWCLTSAVVMTILMLLSVEPGKKAYLVIVKSQRR
jgi:uncharacterized membrane protein